MDLFSWFMCTATVLRLEPQLAPLNLTKRLYALRSDALSGKWNPPAGNARINPKFGRSIEPIAIWLSDVVASYSCSIC